MPALLLDATAAPQLVEAALGVPVAVTQIRAELPPGVEVLQLRDTAMPRRSLHRKPTEGGAGFDRARERRREDLAAMLEVQAAMHRGECGAILQKDPERLLREEAGERLEQAGVQLAHFGAIRGLDGWRDCRSLVAVARCRRRERSRRWPPCCSGDRSSRWARATRRRWCGSPRASREPPRLSLIHI